MSEANEQSEFYWGINHYVKYGKNKTTKIRNPCRH